MKKILITIIATAAMFFAFGCEEEPKGINLIGEDEMTIPSAQTDTVSRTAIIRIVSGSERETLLVTQLGEGESPDSPGTGEPVEPEGKLVRTFQMETVYDDGYTEYNSVSLEYDDQSRVSAMVVGYGDNHETEPEQYVVEASVEYSANSVFVSMEGQSYTFELVFL